MDSIIYSFFKSQLLTKACFHWWLQIELHSLDSLYNVSFWKKDILVSAFFIIGLIGTVSWISLKGEFVLLGRYRFVYRLST